MIRPIWASNRKGDLIIGRWRKKAKGEGKGNRGINRNCWHRYKEIKSNRLRKKMGGRVLKKVRMRVLKGFNQD